MRRTGPRLLPISILIAMVLIAYVGTYYFSVYRVADLTPYTFEHGTQVSFGPGYRWGGQVTWFAYLPMHLIDRAVVRRAYWARGGFKPTIADQPPQSPNTDE